MEIELLLHVYVSTRTQTGLGNLRTIDSPCGVFDPELEHCKFAEESWEEHKNPISQGEMCIKLEPKVKCK